MAIWSRNKIWGASTFNTDVDVADNTNNASQVPATSFLGLKISSSVDAESRNRSKWFTSVIGQLLRAVLHKEEDRATSSDLGVSGTEPTTTKYVTVEQLPSVSKTTNDFTGIAGSGALINNQNTIDITPVLTGTGKSFIGKLHTDFVAWLLARTRTEAETVTLVNSTIYGSGTTTGLIPVGTIWDYCGLDDPDGFINLCLTGSVRSISKASGAGTLKNDNYQNLFIKLYLSYADLRCPVSGGRSGADATAALNDFVSGKAISLPDYRGRVGGYYKLGDANFGEIGKQIGTDTIDATKLPLNSPWALSRTQTGGANYSASSPGANTYFNASAFTSFSGGSQYGNADSNTSPITSDIWALGTNVSSDRKFFTPTIIQTAIIKY
jgi:hypothetical protein